MKVSVSVLGPGDVCVDLKATRNAQDDVEANLLWSAGVHLQPAYFKLSIFCAQNLPRSNNNDHNVNQMEIYYLIVRIYKSLVR